MNDTPRTDAVWKDKNQNILEHARTLERELAAEKTAHTETAKLLYGTTAERDRLKDTVADLHTTLSAYTNCATDGRNWRMMWQRLCEQHESEIRNAFDDAMRISTTTHTTKMNDTPRTSELLRRILDRDGQVGNVLGNAPEEWVMLCRDLEDEIARLKALNLRLTADLNREMERNDFREACARVNATLENTPL